MKDFQAYLTTLDEVGYVQEVVRSILYVTGLPTARANELVVFETGGIGQITTLAKDTIEVLFFGSTPPSVGSRVARTGQSLEVPVDDSLLGKTIDSLCNTIDRSISYSKPTTTRPLYNTPLGIQNRKRIDTSFETGVSIVDMMVPLGQGQRILVIGDRKTGKTDFLHKTIYTQASQGLICIYVAIGKKQFDIKKTEEYFIQKGIMKNIVLVASSSHDPTSMIFLTPYTGMTIAEHFRDQGKNVLVVFDDLSTHAKIHREISLLARHFPGRNSYPGDMFYTHAQLMERAGNFTFQDKHGSITCIPVAETSQGDLVGYIQTNLMSMTDGHLYFDIDLFTKGRRPAINPFLSVTRVGRQTQTQLRREINRELTSFLTLYEKVQSFVHFGSESNQSTLNTLATGDRIIAFFNQEPATIISMNLQIFLFTMLWVGKWQNTPIPTMRQEITKIRGMYESSANIRKEIDTIVTNTASFNILIATVGKRKDIFATLATLDTTTKKGLNYVKQP